MEKITEKQLKYIYAVLKKEKNEYFDYEQLKSITKQEANGIIKRNIIKGSPLYQWYIWEMNNEKYTSTTRANKPSFEIKDFLKYGIIIYPKIFLNKRLAEEYCGKKLTQKSPHKYYGNAI